MVKMTMRMHVCCTKPISCLTSLLARQQNTTTPLNTNLFKYAGAKWGGPHLHGQNGIQSNALHEPRKKRNSPWLGVCIKEHIIALCRALISSRTTGDDVHTQKKRHENMETRTTKRSYKEKTRLDQLSPRLYSVCAVLFMMRAFPPPLWKISRTVRTLQSPV